MTVGRKLSPGAPMPAIKLPAANGGELQLGGEGRWQVAVVYRGRHCPLCRKYLKALDGLIEQFRGIGAEAIAVSGDPRDRAHEEAKEENWRFPVACELSRDQMRALGLYISRAAVRTGNRPAVSGTGPLRHQPRGPRPYRRYLERAFRPARPAGPAERAEVHPGEELPDPRHGCLISACSASERRTP